MARNDLCLICGRSGHTSGSCPSDVAEHLRKHPVPPVRKAPEPEPPPPDEPLDDWADMLFLANLRQISDWVAGRDVLDGGFAITRRLIEHKAPTAYWAHVRRAQDPRPLCGFPGCDHTHSSGLAFCPVHQAKLKRRGLI